MIARLLKALLVLAILAFLGLVAYAYLGNLAPVQSQVTQPVTLDAN
jgi:predicted small integral membrane protein